MKKQTIIEGCVVVCVTISILSITQLLLRNGLMPSSFQDSAPVPSLNIWGWIIVTLCMGFLNLFFMRIFKSKEVVK